MINKRSYILNTIECKIIYRIIVEGLNQLSIVFIVSRTVAAVRQQSLP